MSDNFDLKKFLKESKTIENLNPVFHKLNENKTTETTKNTLVENNLRAKIREMVLAELGGGEDYDLESRKHEYGINPEMDDEYEVEDEDELYEAKKDKAEKEDMPVEDAEIDIEMEPEMDAPEAELTAAAASATGDAKELINNLMVSLDAAKAMGNEKLTTQILNTLKFVIDQSMAQ